MGGFQNFGTTEVGISGVKSENNSIPKLALKQIFFEKVRDTKPIQQLYWQKGEQFSSVFWWSSSDLLDVCSQVSEHSSISQQGVKESAKVQKAKMNARIFMGWR